MTRRKRYEAATGYALPRTRPRPRKPRDPAMVEAIYAPLAWSAIVAGALGILASMATWILRLAIRTAWPWWTPPAVGLLVAVLAFAWRVAICEADRRRLLLWEIEQATGRDLDQDGWAGPPGAAHKAGEPRLIYVHDARRQNRQTEATDWRFWLREAYGERGPTRRAWVGQRLPSGTVMTRERWEAYTERLIQAGVASRPYDTAPLQLEASYREALQAFRETL